MTPRVEQRPCRKPHHVSPKLEKCPQPVAVRDRGISGRWNPKGSRRTAPKPAPGASRTWGEGAQVRPRSAAWLAPHGRDPGDAPRAFAARGGPGSPGVAGREGPRGSWIPGARRRSRGPHHGFAEPRGLGFPVRVAGGDPRLPPREGARSHRERCARGAAPVSRGCRKRAGARAGRRTERQAAGRAGGAGRGPGRRLRRAPLGGGAPGVRGQGS